MASEFLYGTFPDGFMWSTATASYQIEGAWDTNGKGASIWDEFSHTEGKVHEGHTGDVACDSYHKYKEDAKLAQSLGTSHYRFSLSWPRILPKGTLEVINQDGIDYYNNVIDSLLEVGVQPMVTLYHWDLPQALHEQGGWTNPKLAEYFRDYAKLCYKHFGDRVKNWITFNETMVFVFLGYGNGEHAPGVKDPTRTTFLAGHTVLRAHAMAYRSYDEFRSQQKGEVGITLNMDWAEPKDPNNPEHVACAERVLQFKLGWWANPIYGNGDYPEILKEHLVTKAKQLGMEESPLPKFTPEEIEQNKGSWDFFGLNHYTTRIISPLGDKAPTDEECALMDVVMETDPAWQRGQSRWLYVVPWGLRRMLQWVKKTYNNPKLYVTENGFSDQGDVDDQNRINYYKGYINEVLKAVRLDGCDVRGYTAWSLIDNFEWAMGYSERFGLHRVDFDDPERRRSPKASAKFYASVIKNNGFPNPV